MKPSNLASRSTLLRAALILGGGVAFGGGVGACAASAGPPPPFERTRAPERPPPLFLVDGVILEGGFQPILGEGTVDWVQGMEVVRAPEARARWGEDARSGAILLSYRRTVRGDAPPAGASLQGLVEDHLPLLKLAYARDLLPAGLLRTPHLPGDGDPAWARALVVVDGEILGRPRPSTRAEALAREPPLAWLGERGDKPARDFSVRSIRGAEAAALYGAVAWFGVIRIETHDEGGG